MADPREQGGHVPPLERVNYVPEMVYLAGHEESIGVFPLFQELQAKTGIPVKHGMTWGTKSANMAPSDKFENTPHGVVSAIQRNKDFLTAVGVRGPEVTMRISPAAEMVWDKSDLFDVDRAALEKYRDPTRGDSRVKANALFTIDPEIAFTEYPADCPTLLIAAKIKLPSGETGIVKAMVHDSFETANKNLHTQAIEHLIKFYGVNPKDMWIAMTPGISGNNYWVDDDRLAPGLWDGFVKINGDNPKNGKKKAYIDIPKKVLTDIIKAGAVPEQIQSFKLDSYEEAKKKKTFSNRLSSESAAHAAETHNQNPYPNGRMMLVLQ